MSCRCEPHASRSNRCDFCKAEVEIADSYAPAMSKLSGAVALIQQIAGDVNGVRHWASACDAWLEANDYECEASRRRKRERRAEQLDSEIARLRAERAKL